ncbi:HAMP domain-containing sensor histidine kinase [Streptomyces sp. NPDC004610]|uniref:sensor histidine kinase n=1 Tax=unclassified Streptomyces TaxID=2593676 RepID=UPI00339DB090
MRTTPGAPGDTPSREPFPTPPAPNTPHPPARVDRPNRRRSRRITLSPRRISLSPRRITLRARLTLVYGLLFLAAGVVLLGTTYALFNQRLQADTSRTEISTPSQTPPPDAGRATGPGEPSLTGPDGRTYTGDGAEDLLRNAQEEIRDAATASLITQGGIALLIVGGAAAGLGWLIAGRVLDPLQQVTHTARRIAAAPAADRGLHERIGLDGPDDEVKDLARTFNAMVERLDRSFDGQRRFVANASHELRTPLALHRALVEMAMHRRTASSDVKELGGSLLEISTRQERLIAGLLLLAGAENHLPERHPTDLADIAAHVIHQSGPEADRAGITVTHDFAPAPTRGGVLLLERVIQNLVENGIRHNDDPDGWVRVTTRTRQGDGTAAVVVANSGPDLAPYEIPTLFEPFRRIGTERLVTAKGAGLGLSIVRAIVDAHEGTVTAVPNQNGGLTVTVTLPSP